MIEILNALPSRLRASRCEAETVQNQERLDGIRFQVVIGLDARSSKSSEGERCFGVFGLVRYFGAARCP